MGEVWPAAQPGRSGSEYGSASLSPQTPVEVRSCQTIVLTYTVGMFGLDDTGGIKVVQRFTNDGGRWQTDVPTARNYVTARASNGCRLTLLVEPFGHQRPWDRSLRIVVNKGSMRQGDRIEVIFGDRSPRIAGPANADLQRKRPRVPGSGRRLRHRALLSASGSPLHHRRRGEAGSLACRASDSKIAGGLHSPSGSEPTTSGATRPANRGMPATERPGRDQGSSGNCRVRTGPAVSPDRGTMGGHRG